MSLRRLFAIAILLAAAVGCGPRPIARYEPPSGRHPARSLVEERSRLQRICDAGDRHDPLFRIHAAAKDKRIWFTRHRTIGHPDRIEIWAYEETSGELVYYRLREGTSGVYLPCLSECSRLSRRIGEDEFGARPATEFSPADWQPVCGF